MRTVSKPATPSVLKRTAEEIVPVYHYDGRQKAIGDYLDTHPVTGLLAPRGPPQQASRRSLGRMRRSLEAIAQRVGDDRLFRWARESDRFKKPAILVHFRT